MGIFRELHCDHFPYHRRFSVFAELSSVREAVDTTVRVISEGAAFAAVDRTIRIEPTGGSAVVEADCSFDCEFRSPGEFIVQILAENVVLAERRFRVIVTDLSALACQLNDLDPEMKRHVEMAQKTRKEWESENPY